MAMLNSQRVMEIWYRMCGDRVLIWIIPMICVSGRCGIWINDEQIRFWCGSMAYMWEYLDLGEYIYNIIYGIYMIYIYIWDIQWGNLHGNMEQVIPKTWFWGSAWWFLSMDFQLSRWVDDPQWHKSSFFFGLTTPTRDGVWKTNHFTRIEWGFTGIYIYYIHIYKTIWRTSHKRQVKGSGIVSFRNFSGRIPCLAKCTLW